MPCKMEAHREDARSETRRIPHWKDEAMARVKKCSLCGEPITGKVYFYAQPDTEEETEKLVPVCARCASLKDPDKAARDVRRYQSN